jgi:predicted component of type VI protein secretion system
VTEDAPELAFDADALSESLDPRAIVAALKGQLPPEESWPAPGALPAPQPARSPRTSPGAGGADARAIGEPGLAREGDAAGPEALLRALLDGAGLAPTHAEPLTAAQAHAIGRLLRVCALGVRDLLETGQPTPGGDPGTGAEEATGLWHPLLAAPSAEAAVAMLLGRGAAEAPQGGDSDPVASLQSAFDALRGRDQALPKALRGAFQMALARLRPQSLIAQVTEGRSLVGSIFPGSLKSKLWNAYEKAYEHSREEIDGDFLRALRWELLRLTEESGNSPGTGPAEPA